jgi:hypothetical protein
MAENSVKGRERAVLFLIVYVLALALLGACWAVGEQEFRTKVILTLIYLGTWALLLTGHAYFVVAAQALFSALVGSMTFGTSWGRRR